MAIPGGFFGKFFGNTIGNAAGYAIGGAVQKPLEPLLIELEQINWRDAVQRGLSVAPDAVTLALGVAQGQVDEGVARAWAAFTGVGHDQFSALVSIANVGPGMGEAFNLWRRGEINEAGFRRAVKRLGIE